MEYLVLLLIVYFLPTWAAPAGRRGSVFVVNLAFGWTILGWFIALWLALRAREDVAKKAGV